MLGLGLWGILRIAGGGIGIAALLITSVGLAARSVPPSSTWWPQLAALVLPVVAPVAGVAGVAWLLGAIQDGRPMIWGFAVLHLVAAGLFAARAMSTPPTASNGETALRVLSLNAAWSRRGMKDEIADRFATAAPDIIALQEVSIRPGADEGTWVAQGAPLALLQDSLYALATHKQSPGESEWMSNGTALFARVPTSQAKAVLLDTVSTTHSGRYTRTEVEWGSGRIALYNVHFRSFRAPRPWTEENGGLKGWWAAARATESDFVARETEAQVFRRALEEERLPYIVAGDFNATPHQWSYAHVAQRLVDVMEAARGWGATYPDRRPLVRIDAILASPHWSVRDAQVQPGGISDHRAILADLVLNGLASTSDLSVRL